MSITAENPTAEATTEVPLPPAPSEATFAQPDMFMNLEADSFKPINGFPAAEMRQLPAVEKYSGGLAKAFIIRANPEYKWQGAPWHLHHLNVHFNYIIKGWAVFEFEGVGKVRLEAGTGFYQPPRNRHREIDASTDFEVLAVELPASYPTTFYTLDPETGEYRTMTIDAESEGGELTTVVKVAEAG